MCVALIAVLLGCAGTSYGQDAVASAVGLITSKKIKNNTIQSKDVKNGALLAKDFKRGELPSGPAGPQGTPGAQGPAGPAGQDATAPALEPWRQIGAPGQPPFELNWSSDEFGYNVGAFRKGRDGTVELSGAVGRPADGPASRIFVLPEGYRPETDVVVPVASFDGGGVQTFGAVEFEVGGDVEVYTNTDDRFVSLDGVRFSLDGALAGTP